MKRGKYNISDDNLRTYSCHNSIIFKKNNESFGELSNMSMKFPLEINGVKVLNTEALYQSFRFPHIIDLQNRIIGEKSPMKVKMISNANKKNSREDWEQVKLKIMKWCLNIKLAQHFISFGYILDATKDFSIVENSSNDNFWGAVPNEGNSEYRGQNALGRLLMQLREEYKGQSKYSLLVVEKPKIDNFILLGNEITIIDCRNKFIEDLKNYYNNEQFKLFVETSLF